MAKEYIRRRRNPKNPKKTGEVKPCKQCGKDFDPQCKFNVYCWECNERIEGLSNAQRIVGVW